MINRRRLLWGSAWLGIVIGLPIAGRSLRRVRTDRCDFDGDLIMPIYQVRVVDAQSAEHRFCCVLCAEQWIERAVGPLEVFVTDETTGRELPAERAVFVRSNVVTQPSTGNRIHAFADRGQAARHAREAGGKVLSPAERPLRSSPPSAAASSGP